MLCLDFPYTLLGDSSSLNALEHRSPRLRSPATVTAGISEPEFGPTPSVPYPLLRGSRQENSRSWQFFQFDMSIDPPAIMESNDAHEDLESKANQRTRL